mmetsp:Transcript_6534/g.10790  ORF Transcript_6534/g.10790 Transcript_6534/m.10790 type:complete len:527 (-) Transcript_6534:71-1651(-)
MEGAGSCAELNLKNRDLVNFWAANIGDAEVILVADIERCGVFAQVIGTIMLLSPRERQRIKGIIINKFRGDPTLFADGVRIIEEKTQIPVLGVVPYFRGIHIDSEDALPLHAKLDPPTEASSVAKASAAQQDRISIAVLYLPHISNFTDFLPLAREEGVDLHFLQHRRNKDLSQYDVVIIPGSKNVRFDLRWLREEGWADALNSFRDKISSELSNEAEQKSRTRRRRAHLVGVCGGYQMMGHSISDPAGYDGEPGMTDGLGFLPVDTEMKSQGEKVLRRCAGVCVMKNSPLSSDSTPANHTAAGSPLPRLYGVRVSGYEIHLGDTRPRAGTVPMFQLSVCPTIIEQPRGGSKKGPSSDASWVDGASVLGGRIWGTYLHGVFDDAAFRLAFLASVLAPRDDNKAGDTGSASPASLDAPTAADGGERCGPRRHDCGDAKHGVYGRAGMGPATGEGSSSKCAHKNKDITDLNESANGEANKAGTTEKGCCEGGAPSLEQQASRRDKNYDLLANHFEKHLAMSTMFGADW